MKYELNVPTPHHFSYVVRNIPEVTVEQRERALKSTHYNEFAFPAGMLTVDLLSDSGTTAMTDQQWSAMFLGDESYGRNKGYYVLLDTLRDIFERGGEKNWKKILDLVRTDETNIDKLMDKMYLCEYVINNYFIFRKEDSSTEELPRWKGQTPSSSSKEEQQNLS